MYFEAGSCNRSRPFWAESGVGWRPMVVVLADKRCQMQANVQLPFACSYLVTLLRFNDAGSSENTRVFLPGERRL